MGPIEERIGNIKANRLTCRNRLGLPFEQNFHTVQLVCYGPSLRDTWRQIDVTGEIVTVSAAHDYLIGRGLIPSAHIEFDWRPHKAKHIARSVPEITYYLASCVSPDVLEAATGLSMLWHAEQSGAEREEIKKHEPDAYLVPGGSSVGLRAIELLYAMGYRRFDIHGMDSSFRDTEWAGRHFGKSRLKREIIEIPFEGRTFKTSIAFLKYADEFRHLLKIRPDITVRLHGDGLMQTMTRKMEAA